ncbi:DUF434 domain-containing protein [Methanobacterium alcaliphilum]|uniref:DUF434 domain-containing protein n=1 Tax=Methanobacterium alcaliphilum TaxID=392018 RepID=UPI00200B3340|nr:DUF434 domain-containing protein [Methanobacterium alcaliphilum]MCK9152201.1 DUF434 domain-containing protein [Methanobacterium alcaliphilum]
MDIIKKAAKDLRYLLDNGYRKKIALNFVGNHYLLNQNQRNYLSRCIFSKSVIKERENKITSLESVYGNIVFIDGYNVLITTETILLKPENLIMAQDGVLRDSSGIFGKYKFKNETLDSLNLILKVLKDKSPSFVKFYFDEKVSFSGRLSQVVNNFLEVYGIPGASILSSNVDFDLVKEWEEKGGFIASSDGAMIDKVKHVIDIPFFILNEKEDLMIKKC